MSASLAPPSFRVAFGTQLEDQPLGVQQAHKTQWNAITDIYQSIVALNTKVEGVKSTASATATTVENINNSSETIIEQIVSQVGNVNNQTGVTSYTTLPSDYGSFLIFSDASPVAVSLSTLGSGSGISLPWYAMILNFGVGTVTVTPSSGTITYPNNLAAATMPVTQGNAVSIVYDGTNFWGFTIPVPPQTIAAVTSRWLNSYTESTGLFTATQPAFTDISGTVSPSQLPTPTTSTLGGVEANTPVSHQWINAINTSGVPQLSQPAFTDVSGQITTSQLPPSGLSVTITTAKLTTGGTQGSMVFTNGILTSQVQAT